MPPACKILLIKLSHVTETLCAGYVLDADSPAALRPQWDRRGQRRLAATAGAKNAKAVQAGWGDALANAAPLNPHFKEEELRGYRWGHRPGRAGPYSRGRSGCARLCLMFGETWAGGTSQPASSQPTNGMCTTLPAPLTHPAAVPTWCVTWRFWTRTAWTLVGGRAVQVGRVGGWMGGRWVGG